MPTLCGKHSILLLQCPCKALKVLHVARGLQRDWVADLLAGAQMGLQALTTSRSQLVAWNKASSSSSCLQYHAELSTWAGASALWKIQIPVQDKPPFTNKLAAVSFVPVSAL